MARRTTIVDNNTWNNTHIAGIGRIMASSEAAAYPLVRQLDIDYLLVVFGGRVGYASDDINKFAWMVKISSGVHPSDVKESAFGHFAVSSDATHTMQNSMMYKMCYYRFASSGGTGGRDALRGPLGRSKISFHYFEEAFTTENWMVRLYRVKEPGNRSPGHTRFRALEPNG
eukprot:NODE_4848_length_745_cov_44.132686_g4825_i0.p1 GENE.NODE_4848_length_745_cov_44.132686_g4825_i0~~NODE_4848_length_745_cov_44.132686_g4825_i0.p1  ORF type:complete len:197 (-),score=40.22 NODE_4848_length_745_cov_44.132686_g4825_i0:155-667(-)